MPSKHPRLKTLTTDFFAGLKSFRQLEQRISALPESSLQRGDALEIFVEAYLQTNPLFQIEELWLVNQIPASVRQQLSLKNNSKGIDGVYRKSDGTLVPYQVKFRQGRPQVGVRDTSTFFTLTDKAIERLLVSNSDRYGDEIHDRDRLLIVRGSDFDEMSEVEFACISDWLKSKTVHVRRERPLRASQAKALEAIVAHLRSEPRATAVMPCGTGKTLVGLRAVEALKPKNVIVFVPSLALLAQLLEDWAKDTTWGKRFRHLCVCSQPAVSAEVDRWELSPTDVHFPVKTDPAVVRSFLKHDGDKGIIRVIFSTYQSAKKVAAGLPRGFRFDVGLFDEAHKTTEGGFGLALDDKKLPINKRLFLTATPRHIDIGRRDKAGDFKVVSMDDPEIYGPRAFSQSFAEAVAEGIICDYRIVVAVVDRSEISEYAERHGITLVQDDANATRWVASQIAVQKAIEETGASKLITFHSRVNQAKDFASKTPRGISQFLPGFEVGHVNGTQPVTDRKDVLKGFRGDGKMLVTNARCLTEGVDLPAVDAVVFNNPRRSKVDIVQAVGRAMRKPPNSNKQLGYVVIPVLLEKSDTADLEESCRGTEWEDLVAVAAALRDHDSRLEDMIREAQEAAGRGGVFDPRPFGDKITILGRPHISLQIIQRHVSAVILEQLGETWDQRYGQLQTYRESKGHCSVPKTFDRRLAVWIVDQRQLRKKGILSKERIHRLDALGFVWDENEAAWDAMYAELQSFKAKHGHCDVPKRGSDSKLGQWVSNQRATSKRGRMSAVRIDRLSALGFIWESIEAAWESKYKELKEFHTRNGHCSVSKKFDRKLAIWVVSQRQLRKSGRLSQNRIQRLDSLDFAWDENEASWETMIEALRDFKSREGHCNVPARYPANRQLGKWLSRQRQFYRSRKLSSDRSKILVDIGVEFDPIDKRWNRLFAELQRFHRLNGHSKVSSSEDPELGIWVVRQRKLRKRGALPQDKVSRLNALNFAWDTKEKSWEQQFAALLHFKKQYGHCDVPSKSASHRALGTWLNNQRQLRRRGALASDRLARLEEVGVNWNPFNLRWDLRFEQLAEFRKRNGHCNVSQSGGSFNELGKWLSQQRIAKRRGTLSREREKRLNSLGVIWNLSHAGNKKRPK
jgi:superfamily II DNA or RNA helicase